MNKKPGAQQNLEKSTPFFGHKTSFLQAYPQVKQLDLVVEAEPMGFGDSRSYHYSLDNPPGQYCPCPNRHCTDGGFDMGLFINLLIDKKQTHGESQAQACIGHEKIGRNNSRTCLYTFKAKAVLQYEET